MKNHELKTDTEPFDASRELNALLGDLAKAPDGQIAKEEGVNIKALIGKPANEIAEGLEVILNDCCNYSLASDFAMGMLEIALEQAEKLSRQN